MQPFILLNKNIKETFKDYTTTKEILKRYQNLKDFPIKDLKKQAKRALVKSLIKEFTKNNKEVLKGNFESIIFYKKMNLNTEYQNLKEIRRRYEKNKCTEFLIKSLDLNPNIFTDCIDEKYKQFYNLKRVEAIIIEKKLNKKNFKEVTEICKILKAENIKRKTVKQITRILLISLRKKSQMIFSEDEKRFLNTVNFAFKEPIHFLKPIYKECLSNKKSTVFLLKERLYNKEEIGKFLMKNFNLFLKEFKCKFLFEIERPKNVSKLYFLLHEFDKNKAEIIESYIYMSLCNYILRNQTINYERCLYFEKMLKFLRANSNFKRIWLIYKLYLYDYSFKTDKEYIHKIQKSIMKYFPPYFEIKLDLPLEINKKQELKRFDFTIKDNQKRLDLFSTLKIKIEEEILIITFVQFLLIISFQNEEEAEEEVFDDILTASNIKYFYFQYINGIKGDYRMLRPLEPHFVLIRPIIDKYFQDSVHNLKSQNSNLCNNKSQNYIPEFYSNVFINNESGETQLPMNVNANIIRLCKKEKTIKKLNLFKKLDGEKINYATFLKTLKELEEKGYLETSKEFVKYIP